MSTSREEILEALRKNLWKLPPDTTLPNLLAVQGRRRVAVRFDATGRITAAAISHPLPFNQGMQSTPLTSHRKQRLLAFIRGEK
jgi:hypothetical protein